MSFDALFDVLGGGGSDDGLDAASGLVSGCVDVGPVADGSTTTAVATAVATAGGTVGEKSELSGLIDCLTDVEGEGDVGVVCGDCSSRVEPAGVEPAGVDEGSWWLGRGASGRCRWEEELDARHGGVTDAEICEWCKFGTFGGGASRSDIWLHWRGMLMRWTLRSSKGDYMLHVCPAGFKFPAGGSANGLNRAYQTSQLHVTPLGASKRGRWQTQAMVRVGHDLGVRLRGPRSKRADGIAIGAGCAAFSCCEEARVSLLHALVMTWHELRGRYQRDSRLFGYLNGDASVLQYLEAGDVMGEPGNPLCLRSPWCEDDVLRQCNAVYSGDRIVRAVDTLFGQVWQPTCLSEGEAGRRRGKKRRVGEEGAVRSRVRQRVEDEDEEDEEYDCGVDDAKVLAGAWGDDNDGDWCYPSYGSATGAHLFAVGGKDGENMEDGDDGEEALKALAAIVCVPETPVRTAEI
jgi:hypothetical protein